MGFSISSSHLVFFLASMIVAATLAGVFITTTDSISSGIREKEESLTERLRGEMTVINDPNNVPNDPLILYIKNTGSTRMNITSIDVLINGELQVLETVELVEGDNAYWSPTEVIKVEIDINLPEGDHWLKIVGPNQLEDTMEFNI